MLTLLSRTVWLVAYVSVGAALLVLLGTDGPTSASVPTLVLVTLVAGIVGIILDRARRQS